MTGVSNKPKIPSNGTISYLLGAFFLLMSLGSFGSHGYIAGLLFFLAAIFTIPPAVNQLKKKINVSMPGIAQFFVVFLLVAIAFAAFPATPAATNNTSSNTERIAAPPSSVNSSEAIAVPANQTPVTISNSTPGPANASAAKKIPMPVTTPASTPTQTLDNKGKLDILTSPTGATITVDGISEGVSPIEGLSVDAGPHSITVYLSGYDSQQEKVEVANSETKELFYTLVPTVKQSSTSTSTSEETSTSTSEETPTSTSKTSEYQDAQWLTACSPDVSYVANDMDHLSTAASDYDYASLSTYADALYKDSQNAIDASDLYSVSPDLQSAKDEYRLAMVQANWAAVYTRMGVDEYNKGNVKEGTSYLEQAIPYIKSCGEDSKKATELINAYNSKKS